MVYIKQLLASHNKKALDFISYICDERKNLNLDGYKGKNLVRIERNGEEGKIFIDESLVPVLNEFLGILT